MVIDGMGTTDLWFSESISLPTGPLLAYLSPHLMALNNGHIFFIYQSVKELVHVPKQGGRFAVSTDR